MGEYVSPVIRRLLSNVTGNLKKAVGFGDYFPKISEFLSLVVTSLSQNWVRKVHTRILFVKGYRKSIVSHYMTKQ